MPKVKSESTSKTRKTKEPKRETSEEEDEAGTSKKEKLGLPYAAAYATSNRSACKSCKEKIDKDVLRMSARTPSRYFEGLQDNWFHFDCFWSGRARRGITNSVISGFDSLKWDDQELIRDRLRNLENTAEDFGLPKSLTVKAEYAKTGKSKCHTCKKTIENESLRLHFRAAYHHPECVKTHSEFNKTADQIDGYDKLNDEDKKILDALFTGVSDEQIAERKRKHEKEQEELMAKRQKFVDSDEHLEKLKEQAKKLESVAEVVNGMGLSKEKLEMLVTKNGGHLSSRATKSKCVDLLVDILVFGAFLGCPNCHSKIYYSETNHAYKCTTDGCEFSDRHPERESFRLPNEIRGDENFAPLTEYEDQKERPQRIYSRAIEEGVGKDQLVGVPGLVDLTDDARNKIVAKMEKMKKKKAIVKDGLVVDCQFDKHELCHVYRDEDGELGFFEIILVGSRQSVAMVYLCRAWGRLDKTFATHTIKLFDSKLEEAKNEFEKIYKSKTGNEWEDRSNYDNSNAKCKLIDWSGPLVDVFGTLDPKMQKNLEDGDEVSMI
ncbi:Poly [ADP-ribose] polymerase [Aphelenchoides besseyi]|nr:Poly [ADP-ribose] polymerase [Aphelenchoides besseyi]